MSRRRNSAPKLDLKLNLSPPSRRMGTESPERSAAVSPTSPPSSCLSTEMAMNGGGGGDSPEEASSSMVVVGCPRCLMYVMLSENQPKCPKCKSSVLLDFMRHEDNATVSKKNKKKT